MENVSTESLFHFPEIIASEITKELSSLNSKKAETFGNIPTISSDIRNYEILDKQHFPQSLKFNICL